MVNSINRVLYPYSLEGSEKQHYESVILPAKVSCCFHIFEAYFIFSKFLPFRSFSCVECDREITIKNVPREIINRKLENIVTQALGCDDIKSFEKCLEEQNTTVFTRNLTGSSVCHFFIKKNAKEHLLEELLYKYPKLVNAQDEKGFSSLHVAACMGKLNYLKILIKYNAFVNAPSSFGYCPLHFAIEKRFLDIQEFLLENGANLLFAEKEVLWSLIDIIKEKNVFSWVLFCEARKLKNQFSKDLYLYYFGLHIDLFIYSIDTDKKGSEYKFSIWCHICKEYELLDDYRKLKTKRILELEIKRAETCSITYL